MTDMHPSSDDARTIEVDLGGRTVTVPADGLFARYRMQTDLDVVAADPRVRSVDWFRRLDKVKVDSPIGPTFTPNFYYAMSSLRLTMLAPTSALRARLPRELAPLEVVPGVGLASFMLFRYDVADIDFYTEAAVGIAVRPGRHGWLGAADLGSAIANDALHAYVLSLPVNTQIAQVRGHDGYGFPKWVTPIEVDIDSRRARGRILDEAGHLDVGIDVATPAQKSYRSGEKVSDLHSYTEMKGVWHSTFNQTNHLVTGSTLLPRGADLQLGQGRVSDDIRSLRPIRPLRLDVSTVAQAALHLPAPVSLPTAR